MLSMLFVAAVSHATNILYIIVADFIFFNITCASDTLSPFIYDADGGWGAAAADDWEAKEPVDGGI